MIKYHVNAKGEARECKAKPGNCPLGNEAEHYTSECEAQKAYEKRMDDQTLLTLKNEKFSMSLTESTLKIVKKLHNNGITPIIVGGSVRDQFLGIDSKDVDIELYGSKPNGKTLDFNDVKKIFKRNEGFRVDEAGASFAVLKVKVGKEDFDLSFPRTEKSTGTHHRDYELDHDTTMSFKDAASRRDFTINSMGYDPITKKLVDPYNGQDDIRNGILRHVSPAFSDDPLRCLRAVNFASRFGYSLDPETEQLCKDLSPTYTTIANERVEEEFNKLFYKGTHCDKGLTVLYDIGWSKEMLPFKDCSREDFEKYGKTLNKVETPLRKYALVAMMKKDGKPNPIELIESSTKNRDLVERLETLDNAKTRGDIVEAHRNLKTKHSQISNDSIKEVYKILDKNYYKLDFLPETPVEASVTGKWLISKGFKPGPEMGKVIKKAQRIQDETNELDKETLLFLASKN